MAVKRKRITPVGELLRKARQALDYDQHALAGRCFVSQRTVSRWENGARAPSEEEAARLVSAFADAPSALLRDLADALGIEPSEAHDEEAPTIVVNPPIPIYAAPLITEAPPLTAPEPPAPPPAPPEPPRPSAQAIRAALDAVVLAASDEHDVLPRKLRAFGVALLTRLHELGVAPDEAAPHVAPPETRSTRGA
jgi:transcriptional regulator with XRE-family HTH domain